MTWSCTTGSSTDCVHHALVSVSACLLDLFKYQILLKMMSYEIRHSQTQSKPSPLKSYFKRSRPESKRFLQGSAAVPKFLLQQKASFYFTSPDGMKDTREHSILSQTPFTSLLQPRCPGHRAQSSTRTHWPARPQLLWSQLHKPPRRLESESWNQPQLFSPYTESFFWVEKSHDQEFFIASNMLLGRTQV